MRSVLIDTASGFKMAPLCSMMCSVLLTEKTVQVSQLRLGGYRRSVFAIRHTMSISIDHYFEEWALARSDNQSDVVCIATVNSILSACQVCCFLHRIQ